MKTVRVVAAVIRRDGRIFATQRGYGAFKDGWEFPGGKIEPGETPEQALVREIREELDTEIRVGDLLRINNDTHTVVVLEKRDNSVVVTEGNFNSSIHWNREISRSSLEQGNFTVRSRYPAA